MHIVGYAQMPQHNRPTTQRAARAYHCAAGHPNATGHGGVVAHLHVVPNLHQVVEFDAVTQHRVVQRAAIDAGIGAELHVVTHPHHTQLRYFFPPWSIGRKAKPIGPQHRTSVHHGARAHHTALAQRDVRGQPRVLAQHHTLAHHTVRAQHAMRADLGGVLNDDKRPHVHRRR